MPVSPMEVGQVVARKYRVERVLGQGGMGVVVAAMHLQLQQRVAIKFLLREVTKNAEAVMRFEREARAAVKIQSEHVARVMDVGELDDGSPYMVMEYLEGKDLSAVIEDGGPMAPDVAVEYVLQACEAISEAHAAGIVHRDLKPSNLFLARRADGSPLVKVLDFGISKLAEGSDAAQHGLTKTAAFVGSPFYVPPEQLVSSKTADARADIWSLGVILYESISGQPPFLGESMMEIASRILQHPPVPLCVANPSTPRELGDVVGRCLEKNPEHRYQNVGELARALAPFSPRSALSVERISRVVASSASAPPALAETLLAPARVASVPPLPAPPAATQGAWGKQSELHEAAPTLPKTKPWRLLVAIALIAAGAVGSLVVFSSGRGARTDVPSSPGASTVPVAPAMSATASAVGPTLALPAIDPPPAPSASASASATPTRAPIVATSRTAPTAAATITPPSTVASAPLPAPTPPKKNPLAVDVK